MKKTICVVIALMLAFTVAFGLCACGETETPNGGDNTPGTEQPSNPGGNTETPADPAKQNFTGLTLGDVTVTYDGAEHVVEITGTVPEGASVVYENNKATNAGTYNVKATVTKENYNTLVLTAKLVINKADFTGLMLENKTVTYDGAEHVVEITGTVPEGASVVYENNKATNAGTYNVKATVTKENYNTLVLTAKLVINKADFTGLMLENKTVTYDGAEHVVEITGTVPEGASVVYENNKATNAGTYNVKATVTKENYNTLVLTAKLVINKANIADGLLSLSDEKVEYDGLGHSLTLVGDVPVGCTVTYTYNGEKVDSVTAGGEYTVVATVEGSNYNKRTYTAKLTVETTEEQLYCTMFGGTVYFQNPLDGNRLYKYDGTTLGKVNNDEAQYMTVSGDALYYTSKGLLGSNLKKLTATVSASAVYSAKAEYTIVDGGYVYYAVNGLLGGEKNGIYRYSLSAEADETATQIYKGKASWLTIYNGYVYFAAGADKGELMRVPVAEGTASKITGDALDGKNVTEIVGDGNNLYLNIGSITSGYAIFRISLSNNTITKMTTDAGKNLTIIGSNLYYINNDLLTSNIYGKGVYKVALNASGSLPGTKLVEKQVYSLAGDGNYLYYYNHADKHLMRYSVSGGTETDVMAGFVPVDDTYVMGYAETKEYKGEIYYVNPRDGGAIYKYNPATKGNFKVIADACSDFWFDGEYMYYSTYVLTNYDLYKREMKTGADAVRVSKNRVDTLTIAGDYIYYIDNGGTANRIRKVAKTSLDFDTDAVQVGKDNVNWQALAVLNGKIYYCTNPTIGYKKFCYIDVNAGSGVAGTEVKEGETFTYLNGKFYVYNQRAKTIYSYDAASGTITDLQSGVTIVDMVNDGKDVYYASVASGKEGLYKLTVATGAVTKIHTGAVDGLGTTSKGITFLDVKITYASEMPVAGGVSGTGYLYLYDGKTETTLNKR